MQRGFTLVEVLCALAIASLAFVYVSQSLTGSQRAAQRLDDRLNASLIAHALLNQQRQTSPRHEAGEIGKYRWELNVEPSSVSHIAPKGRAIYRVAVRLAWDGGGFLEFETLRLGR